MQARWERLEELAPDDSPPVMDAVLTPNRSLSRQAFLLVIGSFAIVNLGVALVFWLHGAYPVSGFLGLDVVALAWAFKMNYRSGKMVERVLVSPAAVQVVRRPPNKPESYWAVSPLWLHVHDDANGVRLAAGGRDLFVGGFLSPPERTHFAEALRAALQRVKRPA